jgi:hypothetical protein
MIVQLCHSRKRLSGFILRKISYPRLAHRLQSQGQENSYAEQAVVFLHAFGCTRHLDGNGHRRFV